MAIPRKRPVNSSHENRRHLLVGVPMRIAHIGPLVDQDVVEQAAVTIGSIPQFFAKTIALLAKKDTHRGCCHIKATRKNSKTLTNVDFLLGGQEI